MSEEINNARPRVGVGVFIMNKEMDKFLMAKRKDCNRVALMGGHLEKFEQISECAQREVLEESNLSIPLEEFREYPKAFNVVNKENNYHYITFFAIGIIPEGQKIVNTEPHKSEDWEWYGEEDFNKFYQEKMLFYPLELLYTSCNKDFKKILQTIKNQYQ